MLRFALALVAIEAFGAAPVASLRERCRALVHRIGEADMVRLKNNRTYLGGTLLRDQWVDHFTHAHEHNLPYHLPSQLLSYSTKFLEMQRDTFNDWHQGTGLKASVEFQSTNIRGEIYREGLTRSSQLINFPYLRFRFDPQGATEPPASYFGHVLKQTLSRPDQVEVAYDPIRKLLLGENMDAYYLPASIPQGSPYPRILMGDSDIFSIDTLPTQLLHERGHVEVAAKNGHTFKETPHTVFRNVFGQAMANQKSDVFASAYLNEGAGAKNTPHLGLDETYTYGLSVRAGIFNLRQLLQRGTFNQKELLIHLSELRTNAALLRAVTTDSLYIYDEITNLLGKPNSILNIKRENGKMTLVATLQPKLSTSPYLLTKQDQIPESLRLTVEIPIELDPPKLWAMRFAEIIGGRAAATGTYPLPASLRPLFAEHMNGRIKYLSARVNQTNKISQQVENFFAATPSPSREDLSKFTETLR